MSDLLKSIENLFESEEPASDQTGCLARLAEVEGLPRPVLLMVATDDGSVQAAENFGSAVPRRAAMELVQDLKVALAEQTLCRFDKQIGTQLFVAWGVRVGDGTNRGILGGLWPAETGPAMELERLAPELCRMSELAWTAIRLARQADAMRTRIRHLEAEHETLRNAHAEALTNAIEEHEKRLREEREKAAMEQACLATEAANRAKSQFLANMSHEIRTPLNAILGFTELLRKGADEGEEAVRNEYLTIIHTSAVHLLELINDVLDLSKIEAGRLQIERIRCSLYEIVGGVMSLLRVRAQEKGLSFQCEWPDGMPETIQTDPLRLKQLLVNLLGNAVKFTRSGGVRLVVRLPNLTAKPTLCFQVIDTGIGIPADKLETIFDAFSQADSSVTREFGGTGLGLAISRQIARALGGDITVQSEVDRGSVFTVTIDPGPLEGVPILTPPLSDGLPRAELPPPGEEVRLPPSRILVVDDGSTNRKLISLMLSRAGATVFGAENGEVAVEMAAQQPFDLILMDMQMPVLDGYSATRKLRQLGITTPIIALTAHAMAGDEKKCLEAGCTGYLSKPIQSERLLQSVRQALEAQRTEPQKPRTCAEKSAATEALPHNAGTEEDSPMHPTQCATEAPRRDAGLQTPSPVQAGSSAPQAEPLVSTLPADDPDYREIILEFIEILHQRLSAMEQALAEHDFRTLAGLAHWLKGSGGTAGFNVLSIAARQVEQLAKQNQQDQLSEAMRKLRELASRIVVPSAPSEETVRESRATHPMETPSSHGQQDGSPPTVSPLVS